MKKKALALVLAATMVMGGAMTASATELTSANYAAGQEVTGSSTVKVPNIKVTVPTTADIVINPYQLTYDATSMGGTATEKAQIISGEQTIKNESDVAIAVNVVDLKATPDSGAANVNVATAELTAKNTDKSIFLYLEVIDSTGSFAAGYDKASANQVIATNATDKVKAGAKNAIVTLAEGSETATTAKFKFGGAVVTNPVVTNPDKTTAADPWTANDKVNISFKFTFTPQIVAE